MEIWSDGSQFEGEFLNGVKHGKGKFNWSDGSTFEGQLVKNQIEGYGI